MRSGSLASTAPPGPSWAPTHAPARWTSTSASGWRSSTTGSTSGSRWSDVAEPRRSGLQIDPRRACDVADRVVPAAQQEQVEHLGTAQLVGELRPEPVVEVGGVVE